MTYRRRLKSDVWHFVKSCRWWPTRNYKLTDWSGKRPKSGELCNECLSKARKRAAKK